jgi:hypothetical protein
MACEFDDNYEGTMGHFRLKSIPQTLHISEEHFCSAMHLGHDRSLLRDRHMPKPNPDAAIKVTPVAITYSTYPPYFPYL